MPDFYADGEYDLSGFAVGSVKKDSVINGKNIMVGDVLIGLPSSGVHSNGFSLVRRFAHCFRTNLASTFFLSPTRTAISEQISIAAVFLLMFYLFP